MRYKRYRNKKRFNSRVVKMKFQSFVDLATQADNMQIISVNAGGQDVIKRLAPFFGAYKYYKLGGVSIKLIPASTLPVDPTGLSYEAGEQTVDPRDQLTPGMCRITNGEDILENISGLTGDQQRELYNNMLLDSRWYKWMLQSGVKRFGKPKYWQVGQLHQDKWPGAVQNVPKVSEYAGADTITGTRKKSLEYKSGTGMVYPVDGSDGSSPRGLFQTGHRGVLGWMPTDGLQPIPNDSRSQAFLSAVPEIELFKILMPPMHKTNYFYRMFITETVYFKEPIVMNVNGYRPLDVFHRVTYPAPVTPLISYPPGDLSGTTGGNDGSN